MGKKSILYNLLGSLFDKGLPIIISAMLTKYMSANDYGKWSLFYTFTIISNAFSVAPLMAIFSRKFFSLQKDEHKMHIYFYELFFGILLFSLVIYYLFFCPISYDALIEIPTLLLMNLYAYLSLFLRFKGQDLKYMYYSLFRLTLFVVVLALFLFIYEKLNYSLLISAFGIAHLPSFLNTIRYLSFSPKVEQGDLKEFMSLSLYGLSTSLVNGIDKFIIVASNYSLSFLGYYSFIYTLTNTPTLIVEALKKTMNPIMYKEWAMHNKLSSSTMKFLYLIAVALLGIQFVLPLSVYYVLMFFNLVNHDFIQSESFLYINILSLGFFFQGLYHFVNPYYFYYKKSGILLAIQISCMAFYWAAIKFSPNTLSYSGFMWLKTALLITITLLSIFWRFNSKRQK